MIHSALCAVRDTLRRRVGTRPNGEQLVHITCPGKGIEGQRNYLGLMFIGLEQETCLQSDIPQGMSLDANIVFMLYSVFADYGESLHHLSGALSCFQETSSVTRTDFPGLNLPEHTMHIEPYFFPLVQQLQTWNPFMDDSIPFMFYKLRSLRFRAKKGAAPIVKEIDAAFRKGGT
ncbi:Pvc16 family protein [Desulfovibrio cuneatus]|uniref:Pvc16 family protein n=1 Tax=Desulfovibrio cuneatus TaxID=159728 RepID=UPI00041029C7|nr:Pvc16 family protein [Desulfovibrio cuneatus]